MKVKLIFDAWRDIEGDKVYNISLETGDFHAGTTFNAEIKLNEEQEEELKEHLKHHRPVFWMMEK